MQQSMCYTSQCWPSIYPLVTFNLSFLFIFRISKKASIAHGNIYRLPHQKESTVTEGEKMMCRVSIPVCFGIESCTLLETFEDLTI